MTEEAPVVDPCPYCGHSLSADHDETGTICHGQTLLGGDPPLYKLCNVCPYHRGGPDVQP